MDKKSPLDLIHEIKRSQVAACIDIVKQYDTVRRLIIFGSAVTENCDEYSDLDLCLDIQGPTRGRKLYELSRDLCLACEHNCDILTYGKLNDNFRKEEIDKKGVIVYCQFQ